MSKASAFWSYVHRDDDAESGRVSRLARDLSTQYELITGEPISIFVDREELAWGDQWRATIDNSLAAVTFFMPVLTPRYFASEECRREFGAFARRASKLGVRELVMPILYVNVPGLRSEPPIDELMALANSFQWIDWTERRFAAVDSAEYRSSVAAMAERLLAAALIVEKVDIQSSPAAAEPPVPGEDDDDETPGFLERVVQAELGLVDWAGTMNEVAVQIGMITSLSVDTAERIRESDATGAGAAGRIRVLGDFAGRLNEPADAVLALGNQFSAQLGDVDEGIRAILVRAREELRLFGPNQESSDQAERFVGQLRWLASVADEGLGSLEGMVNIIESVEDQSRNLRPVFRKLRRGLTLLVDAKSVINGWVDLIDELELPGDMPALGGQTIDTVPVPSSAPH